jgi:hypothetical protein
VFVLVTQVRGAPATRLASFNQHGADSALCPPQEFNTFNDQRLSLMLRQFLRDGTIPRPAEVAVQERILPTVSTPDDHTRWLRTNRDISSVFAHGRDLLDAMQVLSGERYVLAVHSSDDEPRVACITIFYTVDATPRDVIQGILQAMIARQHLERDGVQIAPHTPSRASRLRLDLVADSLTPTRALIEDFMSSAQRSGWNSETLFTESSRALRIGVRVGAT